MFSSPIFKTYKQLKCQCGNLNSNYFPECSKFWQNPVALSQIKTTKPQRQDSLAPSLADAKKYFSRSVSIQYMNNLMTRGIYLFLLVASGNEIDNKNFLPNFIERKY